MIPKLESPLGKIFRWQDDTPYGKIFKWLDRGPLAEQRVNSRQGTLQSPCTLAFSGGALTPPSTKGMLRPFGNPAKGSHVASHGV